MSWIISIIAIILMVIVHEWGHFIAGRICKIPIYEFSVGMGPLLLQHKGKKETKWSLRAFPLGGYCAFDDLEKVNETKNGILDLALDKLPCHQRIFIAVMGPVMNIVFAFAITFFMLLFAGNQILTTNVTNVMEDMPAAEVLQVGDTIVSVNGEYCKNDNDTFSNAIFTYNPEVNDHIDLIVEREGKEIEVSITPVWDEEEGRYFIGISKGLIYEPMPLYEAFPEAVKETCMYVVATWDGIIGLLTGKYSAKDVSSIVGAVAVMQEYATLAEIMNFLTIACLISVNLGVMNLLPIPALDGSKIAQAIIEKIMGRHINQKVLERVTIASFSILIILGLVIMLFDIIKIINVG